MSMPQLATEGPPLLGQVQCNISRMSISRDHDASGLTEEHQTDSNCGLTHTSLLGNAEENLERVQDWSQQPFAGRVTMPSFQRLYSAGEPIESGHGGYQAVFVEYWPRCR